WSHRDSVYRAHVISTGRVSSDAGIVALPVRRLSVSRITHRRLNVLAREMWICVEELSLGGTFAQFAKNELDWNPRSPDYRLSEHHSGIDFDAISEGHAV